jgi:hypothetical protein
LLFARFAGLASAVGIDEAADADGVAHFPLLHLGADLEDLADDLVTRDHRKDRVAPFVARLDVRVADAAIEDVDEDVVRSWLAPFDRPWAA